METEMTETGSESLREAEGFREAVMAMVRARTKQEAVEANLQAAHDAIGAATEQRFRLRVQAAAGEPVDLADVERKLRECNEAATLYSEALPLAKRAAAEAERAAGKYIDAENAKRQQVLQGAYEQANQALHAAAAEVERSARAAEAGRRGAGKVSLADAENLFQADIERALHDELPTRAASSQTASQVRPSNRARPAASVP